MKDGKKCATGKAEASTAETTAVKPVEEMTEEEKAAAAQKKAAEEAAPAKK